MNCRKVARWFRFLSHASSETGNYEAFEILLRPSCRPGCGYSWRHWPGARFETLQDANLNEWPDAVGKLTQAAASGSHEDIEAATLALGYALFIDGVRLKLSA